MGPRSLHVFLRRCVTDRVVLRIHRLDRKNTKHNSQADQSGVRSDVHGGRQRDEVSTTRPASVLLCFETIRYGRNAWPTPVNELLLLLFVVDIVSKLMARVLLPTTRYRLTFDWRNNTTARGRYVWSNLGRERGVGFRGLNPAIDVQDAPKRFLIFLFRYDITIIYDAEYSIRLW